MSSYLVIGATGNVGSALATQLHEQGHQVRALVRDVSPVTPEEFARRSIERGVPARMAATLQDLHELFRAGRAGVVAGDVTNLTGVAPRSFREWCEDHADVFR